MTIEFDDNVKIIEIDDLDVSLSNLISEKIPEWNDVLNLNDVTVI